MAYLCCLLLTVLFDNGIFDTVPSGASPNMIFAVFVCLYVSAWTLKMLYYTLVRGFCFEILARNFGIRQEEVKDGFFFGSKITGQNSP